MLPRIFVSASMVIGLSLSAQTDYSYVLAKHRGNKIILLGEVKPEDTAKWKQVTESDLICEHGFALLDRQRLVPPVQSWQRPNIGNIDTFETWVRQKYGLNNSATWVALDLDNDMIVPGIHTPTPKEFDQMLAQRGIKTPLRQVRDFLQENPEHLEARADLLKEARRRAMHLMPPNTDEDLDEEADLHIYKQGDADETFNTFLSLGGKFNDISKIVELAKEKGYERLAREWEGKMSSR